MGCRKNSPGKPCCDDCSIPGCPGVTLPDGLKDITFETSAYNPLSETTTGTFARNFSVGTCCARMDLPMTASYLSPVYDGVDFFSDYGKFPINLCCGTTGTVIGFYEGKLQLAASFAYQFLLKLCSIRVDVCATNIPSCGLNVTVTAVMGKRTVSAITEESQSKIRVNRDAYTPCGAYAEVPASDTTEFRRNCSCSNLASGCQSIAESPYPTDFVEQPEPPTVDEPETFDCEYDRSHLGLYYPTGSDPALEYFSITRKAFLSGATSVPCSPISFSPTGQVVFASVPNGYSLLPAPAAWIVALTEYAAFVQPSIDPNACGQARCNYQNFGAGRFQGVCRFIPGQGCFYDYARVLNQPRSLAVGTHFFDPLEDDWELTIC